MRNFLIANGGWGGCHLCIDFNKIDLLPCFRISNTLGNTHIKIAFLMLSFELIFFGSEMKAFLRKLKSGELMKEMDEMAEEFNQQIKEMQGKREEFNQMLKQQQEQADNIKHISQVIDEVKAELKNKEKPKRRKRVAEQ